jgi:hypothetical protein
MRRPGIIERRKAGRSKAHGSANTLDNADDLAVAVPPMLGIPHRHEVHDLANAFGTQKTRQ